jgi:CheY-like chemotaxis protein
MNLAGLDGVKMLKVMIVDDDPGTVKLLSIVISQMGHEAVGASTGREAVEVFPIEQPNIVLLDYMMPGLNGIETLKELKALDHSDRAQFFMLTAIQDPMVEEQANLSGANGYITKPLDFEWFEGMLEGISMLAAFSQ